MTHPAAQPTPPAPSLRADCQACAALCCIGLALDKGPHFAIDKPAGTPCLKLRRHLCSIHETPEYAQFSGCKAYDCQGAGQRVTQELHKGGSWRDTPALLALMLEDFLHARALHDRWALLQTALSLPLNADERDQAQTLIARITAPLPRAGLADHSAAISRDTGAFLAGLRHHVASRRPPTG